MKLAPEYRFPVMFNAVLLVVCLALAIVGCQSTHRPVAVQKPASLPEPLTAITNRTTGAVRQLQRITNSLSISSPLVIQPPPTGVKKSFTFTTTSDSNHIVISNAVVASWSLTNPVWSNIFLFPADGQDATFTIDSKSNWFIKVTNVLRRY